MVYRDCDIDAAKARQLPVIHYRLSKSWRWKQWQTHLDGQLSDLTEAAGRQLYPYLMRSYRGHFGLFVALDSEDQPRPEIYTEDGIQLQGERVEYAPEHNPVWVRLLMRKALNFRAHSRGSNTLGRPLLKIDEWKNENGRGVNTIAVDCRTQQLSDKETTEVALFYENIPLRQVSDLSKLDKNKGALWVYDNDKVLVRWNPQKHEQPDGAVLKQIRKKADRRKTRPFINLGSVTGFERSWPWILKQIQDALVQQAAEYGFFLAPKVLNLRELPTKTKYKNAPGQSRVRSMDLDSTIDVLDLRYSQQVPVSEILNIMQVSLQDKGIHAQLRLLPPLEPPIDSWKIDQLEFTTNQRLLVLLDQRAGVLDDNYELTRTLRTLVACQHINVNPHDLGENDAVKAGLLSETDDGLLLGEGSNYYNYTAEQLKEAEARKALSLNTEIVVKELQLKYLLLCDQAKVSEILPQQSELLTDHLAVITNGYLFTVRNDRPVLLPFDPAETHSVESCDAVLESFSTSVAQLLELLQIKWPYNYRPEAVMQGFGTETEKLTRFARRLTIVLKRPADEGQSITILFQDPAYETPHMLPDKLEETLYILKQQRAKRTLNEWILPELEKMQHALISLGENKQPDKKAIIRASSLTDILPGIYESWQRATKSLQMEGKREAAYYEIKRKALKLWEEETQQRMSSQAISAWDTLVGHLLGLPLSDTRKWLREIPGISRVWYDEEKHYYIVGTLAPLKKKLQRQPSIRQWHALQGELDFDLLVSLIDVDWVRMNQLAGNPCVATLVKRWIECQPGTRDSLNMDLVTQVPMEKLDS